MKMVTVMQQDQIIRMQQAGIRYPMPGTPIASLTELRAAQCIKTMSHMYWKQTGHYWKG